MPLESPGLTACALSMNSFTASYCASLPSAGRCPGHVEGGGGGGTRVLALRLFSGGHAARDPSIFSPSSRHPSRAICDASVHHLLEVVQYQQQLLALEVIAEGGRSARHRDFPHS